MTFKEILVQVIAWLQQDKRVSYGALKRQFALDDAALEDLQDAILYMYPQVQQRCGPRSGLDACCSSRSG